jgi:hypothetical protein
LISVHPINPDMTVEIGADNYLSEEIRRVQVYYSEGRNLGDIILTNNPSCRSLYEDVELCVILLHPSSCIKIRDFPVNRKRTYVLVIGS